MQAAIMRNFGGPDVLEYLEIPTPKPAPNEVLVKVEAAGLNRLDHYVREGSVTRDIVLPHILGSDAAGTVAEIGGNVTRFKPGDRVIPMPGYPLLDEEEGFRPISAAPSYAIRGIVHWGTYAQYMSVPERWLIANDTNLSAAEAATLPMALVTGVRAVKVVGGVKTGESVLIHGSASGTGSINVQIAKALGARVIATVRTRAKTEFVKSLGAEKVLSIEDDFVTKVKEWSGGRGVDVVIDNLGGDIFTRSIDALAPLGRLVSMGMVMGLNATIPLRSFFFAQRQIRGTLMGDVDDLIWGLDQVRLGKVRPTLDCAMPLHQAASAHRRLADGAGRGTTVLLPWET